jgi:Cytochrome c, mono- and diheme variants
MDTGARCQNAEKPLFQNNRPCWGPHSTTNRKHAFHHQPAAHCDCRSHFSQLANAEESNLEGRGKELLDARCAHCHAIARTGESPHSAAPPFRTLARKYPIDELAESLAEGLSVGHPDMPEFVFEPDDITAILAYLNSIQEQ